MFLDSTRLSHSPWRLYFSHYFVGDSTLAIIEVTISLFYLSTRCWRRAVNYITFIRASCGSRFLHELVIQYEKIKGNFEKRTTMPVWNGYNSSNWIVPILCCSSFTCICWWSYFLLFNHVFKINSVLERCDYQPQLSKSRIVCSCPLTVVSYLAPWIYSPQGTIASLYDEQETLWTRLLSSKHLNAEFTSNTPMVRSSRFAG